MVSMRKFIIYVLPTFAVCTCRFFLKQTDFEEECAQYQDAILARVLPQLLHSHNSAAAPLHGPSGFELPSFIVTERGVTLTDWARQPKQAFDVFAMVQNVATLLSQLHQQRRVHRDGATSHKRNWYKLCINDWQKLASSARGELQTCKGLFTITLAHALSSKFQPPIPGTAAWQVITRSMQ